MTHPGEICRCLDEERKNANSNDGLYSRFLICMPKPEFRDAFVNGEILPNTPNLARVFYVIDQMHKTKKVYIYDDDARKWPSSFTMNNRNSSEKTTVLTLIYQEY